MLYNHNMIQHGKGGEAEFKDVPFDIPPWENEKREVFDHPFKEIYELNSAHILANDEKGKVKKVYNYPTDDLSGGVDELMTQINDIYEKEDKAFKLNLSFGFIIENKTTNSLRFYVPNVNSNFFLRPVVITDQKSIRRLKKILNKFDPRKYVLENRPNSNFRAKYITNMRYDVTKLNHEIGCSEEIPEYIQNHRYVKCF